MKTKMLLVPVGVVVVIVVGGAVAVNLAQPQRDCGLESDSQYVTQIREINGEVDSVYGAFPHDLATFRSAQDRIATVRRRLQSLHPPAPLRGVHRLLVEKLRLDERAFGQLAEGDDDAALASLKESGEKFDEAQALLASIKPCK